MSSARWLSPLGRFGIIFGAALLAVGMANAQVASSIESSHDALASSSDSSSSSLAYLADSPDAAEPAAPAPAPAAGQYDNRGGGGGATGWKSHLAFEFGGGFVPTKGDTSKYMNNGYDITVGGGFHLSKALSLLAEYQFLRAGLPNSIIAQAGSDGGNVHLWSLTLDPVFDLMPSKSNSIYVTGGGGFYRKVTNFTVQTPQQYCYYFYCGVGYAPQTVGHFSSNQGGWNVGAGYRHKFMGMYGDGRMQFFAEVRYLDVNTPAVVNQSPNGLGNTTIGAGTKLIPVNFGIRF